MNSLKSLCVIIVLSAITYGAYITLSGRPPAELPGDATGWEEGPQVELPIQLGAGSNASTDAASTPGGGEAPAYTPQSTEPNPAVANTYGSAGTSISTSSTHSDDATPPYMAPTVGPSEEASVPGAYPRTNYPDDPFSGVPGATASAASSEGTSVYGSGNASTSAAQPQPQSAYDAGARYADRYADTTAAAAPTTTDTPPTDAAGQFRKSLETIHRQLDAGRLAEAHLELSEWFDDPQLTPEENAQLVQLLDQLAGTVIYSQQNLLEPAYQVQPGDTLERIADDYHVPWQLLAKINGIGDPQNLPPGQTIKVLRGPFDALVDIDQRELSLFLHGRYAGRFPIGTGNEQSLTIGEYTVQNKVTNPTYYGPEGVVDANDPANPLGECLIDLGQQLGIHGTSDPQSIGQAGGRGCISLTPSDVQDVYDILSIGSRVIIRR